MTTVLLPIHYQNENCHPDGRIKVGIAQDSDWREARLANAARLFAAARAAGIHLVHVRLAVDPDYRGVTANTELIREWIELNAWREGTWGTEFLESLAPLPGETVVTHTRNSAFEGGDLTPVLIGLGARRLIVCGVSTAYAVEGTVRQATDLGYECLVAADACSTATQAQHENALAAMAPLADVHTVSELIEALPA